MKQLLCALRDASLLCLSFPLPHDMMRSRNEMTKEKTENPSHTAYCWVEREDKEERANEENFNFKKIKYFQEFEVYS